MKNLYRGLIKHLIDSTAIITMLNPVMSVLETNVAGMSNELSINARITGTYLTYCGLGYFYSKGRDLSRNIFNITIQASEKTKHIHDALYGLVFSAVLTPPFYYLAGSRDVKEIVAGTLVTMGAGTFIGSPIGYAIDSYMDLTGLEESERVPDLIKNRNPFMKKSLAALLTAGSVGAMAAIYSFTR